MNALHVHQRSNVVCSVSTRATAIVCTTGPTAQRLEERIQQYSMFQNQFEINLNFKDLPRRQCKSTQNGPIY